MKRLFVILITLSLISIDCFTQIDSTFPAIDRTSLPEARFREPEIYSTETLHLYPDIDAALFREYGCLDAWRAEIRLMKGKYIAGIFRMYSPEEAFGIFAATREDLSCSNAFPPWSCSSPYSLQLARGRYFIRITNENGTPADSSASAAIADAITCKISEPSASLSDYLPAFTSEALCAGAFLAKGPSGLSKTGKVSENYMKNSRFETAVIIRAPKRTLISVKFSDPEGIMNFASGRSWRTKRSSNDGNVLESGENVKILSETHILIEIPD